MYTPNQSIPQLVDKNARYGNLLFKYCEMSWWFQQLLVSRSCITHMNKMSQLLLIGNLVDNLSKGSR